MFKINLKMVGGLSRRSFLKFSLSATLNIFALLGGGLTYAGLVEPGWIRVKILELVLPNLAPAFNGYRIAQFSDIHIGTWMNRERLSKAIELVNSLTPDLVVITGDFVHHTPGQYVDDLTIPLSQLKPRDGSLAVLGNHDHWTDPDLVRKILQKSGIIDISNQVHTLERNHAILNIAGVDDHWEQLDRLDIVMDTLPPHGAAILLVHEPDYADQSARTGRFNLQLSGHSHGGQVIIPFTGPPILPLHASKYPLGLYRVREMYLYTNPGIGMISPTVRFNCRPEITLFTLKSPSNML